MRYLIGSIGLIGIFLAVFGHAAADPNLPLIQSNALQAGFCNGHCAGENGTASPSTRDLKGLSTETLRIVSEPYIAPAAWGCRRFLVALYKNCDAARWDHLVPARYFQPGVDKAVIESKVVQDAPEKYVPTQFFNADRVIESIYLHSDAEEPPACTGRKYAPPIFYVNDNEKISLDRSNRYQVQLGDLVMPRPSDKYQEPLTAINCSGAIKSCFASAGLKIQTSGSFDKITSLDFANLDIVMGKKSCLKPALFDSENNIQSGDIVAMAPSLFDEDYGHTVMIESVGADPFGLNKSATIGVCPKKFDINSFDFVVIQSSQASGRMGMTRMRIKDYLAVAETAVVDSFQKIARMACLARNNESRHSAKKILAQELQQNRRFRDWRSCAI